MYCRNCGNKVQESEKFCTNCGNKIEVTSTTNGSIASRTISVNSQNITSNYQEGNTLGWGILGFFMPLIGFILFVVWQKDRPKASKSSGIGALICLIVVILIYVVTIITFFIGQIGEEVGSMTVRR